MKVITKARELQNVLNQHNKTQVIGLVPTMGALHLGHLSIVKRAKLECDMVVVSIFVNPTQFDKAEDLKNYPRTLETDLQLLEQEQCDLVFVPQVEEIYQNDVKPEVMDFDGLDKVMEGAFRKDHFDGVGTIVKKLFTIVNPNKAYFGEKDFQQLQIIKKMVDKTKMNIQIIPCDIYREDDGLAMSSRNTRLSKVQREAAPLIYATLLQAKSLFPQQDLGDIQTFVQQQINGDEALKLEYFEIADVDTLLSIKTFDDSKQYRAFIAVFAGSIRLIDNIALN